MDVFVAKEHAMDRRISIEPVIDHEYLVRVENGADAAESQFVVAPDVLAELGFGAADERRVVEQTAAFLLEHQPVIDFPQLVYLDEVSAAYDAYATELRRRLS
ncbi:hypothetical protein KO481_11770 [Nocardia sp. NEAU-G5]|uniref:Uncharacterized protein n=1 Tax=Nocardia albiluteola TaxID=2842303 RepID=A0ABS6AYB8_9NOCA|nr:hypothetical protein [Nocardia albiluteola]MBU3062201.1 hypothetical protein [Nocardia albiluteola]